MMTTLKKGKFYASHGGKLYYYDGYFLHCSGTKVSLTPTFDPHQGLSSVFHDSDVDIREFEETDPLKYLERKKKSLEELTNFIEEYS